MQKSPDNPDLYILYRMLPPTDNGVVYYYSDLVSNDNLLDPEAKIFQGYNVTDRIEATPHDCRRITASKFKARPREFFVAQPQVEEVA